MTGCASSPASFEYSPSLLWRLNGHASVCVQLSPRFCTCRGLLEQQSHQLHPSVHIQQASRAAGLHGALQGLASPEGPLLRMSDFVYPARPQGLQQAHHSTQQHHHHTLKLDQQVKGYCLPDTPASHQQGSWTRHSMPGKHNQQITSGTTRLTQAHALHSSQPGVGLADQGTSIRKGGLSGYQEQPNSQHPYMTGVQQHLLPRPSANQPGFRVAQPQSLAPQFGIARNQNQGIHMNLCAT